MSDKEKQIAQKMKVLLVSPCRGSFGGIEVFVFKLSEELHRQGVNVRICFKKVKGFSYENSLDMAIKKSPVEAVFVNRASKEFYEVIQWADVVHLQNALPDGAVFGRLRGKAVVATIYNRFGVGSRMHRVLWKAAAAICHRRWYISDFVWSTWEPRGRRRGSGKLPIISDLPTGMVSPAEREGFVFAARWIRNKGLEELVEAYALAKIDHDKWPLTLIGDGPLRGEVEEMVKRYGLTTVKMTGFVSTEERNRLIRHAKWMVTPPKTKEDLGLTPIESRHVGVPAIATRDGGLLEAAGKFSLFCDPGDVQGLKEQIEKAAAMSEEDYVKLSELTRQELLEYLKPLSLYIEEYQLLLKELGAISKMS